MQPENTNISAPSARTDKPSLDLAKSVHMKTNVAKAVATVFDAGRFALEEAIDKADLVTDLLVESLEGQMILDPFTLKYPCFGFSLDHKNGDAWFDRMACVVLPFTLHAMSSIRVSGTRRARYRAAANIQISVNGIPLRSSNSWLLPGKWHSRASVAGVPDRSIYPWTVLGLSCPHRGLVSGREDIAAFYEKTAQSSDSLGIDSGNSPEEEEENQGNQAKSLAINSIILTAPSVHGQSG